MNCMNNISDNAIFNLAIFILMYYPFNFLFATVPDYKPNPETRYIKLLVYNLLIGFLTFFVLIIVMVYYSISIEMFLLIFSVLLGILPQSILIIEENIINSEE